MFIQQVLESFSPECSRILDLACGTGKHAIDLAAMGYSVTGLDLDPEILSIASQAAVDRGLTFASVQEDMREFLLVPPVHLVINMFYSFQNVLQAEHEQQSCLQSVFRSLTAGGLFILEWLPEENNLALYPPGQTFLLHEEARPDDSTLRVISQNRIIDELHKEIIFTYETVRLGNVTEQEQFVSPWFRLYLEPTRRLIQSAGFRIIAEYGDYSLQSPFSPQSAKMILVARKEA